MDGTVVAGARAATPNRWLLWAVFVVLGIAWASTHLLSKIAVRHGAAPLGITLWEEVIGVLMLTPLMILTGRRLPLGRRYLALYLGCGVLGTVLPHWLSFQAMVHLPVGIISILMSLVPMMTFGLSLALGMERFEPRRALGLGLGALAVALIVLPDASLPGAGQAIWVLMGATVALSYAAESAFIARVSPRGVDALVIMTGLTWAALFLLLPLVAVTGSWVPMGPMGEVEAAIVAMSAIHIACYLTFIWLIGRGGPVFAVQVAYPVTAAGVLWGMAVMGESHPAHIWAALVLMFAGIALVKPRAI